MRERKNETERKGKLEWRRVGNGEMNKREKNKEIWERRMRQGERENYKGGENEKMGKKKEEKK